MSELEPRSPHAGMTRGRKAAPGGHHWMMIACCIPMLVIAVALVMSGVANAAAIVFALMCTAMMAVMIAGLGPRREHLTVDTAPSADRRSSLTATGRRAQPVPLSPSSELHSGNGRLHARSAR